jgi:CHAT domain-containing protein/Tfp pilus assembly protein PilF
MHRFLRQLSLALFPLVLAAAAAQVHASETELLDPELASAVDRYRSEGAAAALPALEALLERFTAEGNTDGICSANRYLGELYWRLGNFEAARAYLDRAVALAQSTPNRYEEGKSLNVIGLLRWDEGRYDAALAAFDQVHEIARELGRPDLRASALNNRALVRDELGQYAESMRDYEQALELFRQADDLRGQGDVLGNIGGVYLLMGRYREALEHYREALAISTRLDSRTAMTIDNGNLGLAYSGLGQHPDAMRHFNAALSLARETGMSIEEAYWLRGKAGALQGQGRYGEALGAYRSALQSAKKAGAPALQLDSWIDLGNLLLELGDLAPAGDAFNEATRIATEIGLPQGVTVGLLSLGDIEMARERPSEALALYQDAARRAAVAGEPGFQAAAHARQAHAEEDLGIAESALGSARKAISLAQSCGARMAEAEAWLVLAGVALDSGDTQAALEAYGAVDAAAGGDPALVWQAHHGRADLLAQQGDLEAAMAELRQAIEIIEDVRVSLSSQRHQSGWLQDKYEVYIDLVRLQLESGQNARAFSTAERLRSRVYQDQMQGGGYRGRSEREKQEEFELRARISQLQEALSEEQQQGIAIRRQAAIEHFSAELVDAERAYQAFIDDLGRRLEPGFVVPLPSLDIIQGALGPSEALLEYLVADEYLIAFVLRRDTLHSIVSPVRRRDLQSRVELLRELVASPASTRWLKPATRLTSILVQPAKTAGYLEGASHLIVIPHGALNYLPFALLPLPEQPDRLLIDRFSISYLPAASTLAHERSAPGGSPAILAVAPRSSRLRYAPGEARSVAALFQPDSTLLEGSLATESAFKHRAPQSTVIHLATHGVFNRANPLFSGLVLEPDAANDGMLEVHEILGLSLQADLVTLSACQTALGSGWFRELPAGDEFVGLARAFLQAGSQSILASLWEVNDQSTAGFMQAFYRALARDATGFGRADALARVQRELRLSDQYGHPFFWAPFVLLGQHATGASRS